MFDKLSSLPSTTVSQIRHIRVGVTPIDFDGVVSVWGLTRLKLLPGLCLDTLSVLDTSCGELAYKNLEVLVRYGKGWKVLHYITPNSEMLGFKMSDIYDIEGPTPWCRKPQPSRWSETLTRRDGLDSGASVTIYRSTQSNAPGSALRPETRQLFEQKPPSSPEDLEMFGLEEDKELLGANEREKELLVVVKRGHQAHILEPDT